MTHDLQTIRAVGNRHQATCSCGDTVKAATPEKARVAWYSHRIHALKPACTSPKKKAYGTKQEAENAISRQLRRPEPGRRPIHAYHCPSGQHWHTSTRPDLQRSTA